MNRFTNVAREEMLGITGGGVGADVADALKTILDRIVGRPGPTYPLPPEGCLGPIRRR